MENQIGNKFNNSELSPYCFKKELYDAWKCREYLMTLVAERKQKGSQDNQSNCINSIEFFFFYQFCFLHSFCFVFLKRPHFLLFIFS